MRIASDRALDRALGIQTAGREDERGSRCMPYEPTPYPVLERLAESGLIGSDDHVLDYGCGKGRVAFYLASRVGCRATGIDRSEKLIAMAEENRAGFDRAALVRFECARAETYDPGDADVCFFFNPFSEGVLRAVLKRIVGARTERPRLRLIAYYPSLAWLDCLDDAPGLCRAGEIDCRDLFDGSDPRERIVIYEASSGINR